MSIKNENTGIWIAVIQVFDLSPLRRENNWTEYLASEVFGQPASINSPNIFCLNSRTINFLFFDKRTEADDEQPLQGYCPLEMQAAQIRPAKNRKPKTFSEECIYKNLTSSLCINSIDNDKHNNNQKQKSILHDFKKYFNLIQKVYIKRQTNIYSQLSLLN